MKNKLWRVLVLVTTVTTISGCVPIVIGAAGMVAADKLVEQKEGGDGLF